MFDNEPNAYGHEVVKEVIRINDLKVLCGFFF